MELYILTGMPGYGKTSVIKQLELYEFRVIHEAATDIITEQQYRSNSEPWRYPDFIDKIITLQKQRQISAQVKLQYYDRSQICTYALAIYLGFAPSGILQAEIDRIINDNIYQKRVFFLENLGFIENTNVRKITFEEALKFEETHLCTYKKFGFELVKVKSMPIVDR